MKVRESKKARARGKQGNDTLDRDQSIILYGIQTAKRTQLDDVG